MYVSPTISGNYRKRERKSLRLVTMTYKARHRRPLPLSRDEEKEWRLRRRKEADLGVWRCGLDGEVIMMSRLLIVKGKLRAGSRA